MQGAAFIEAGQYSRYKVIALNAWQNGELSSACFWPTEKKETFCMRFLACFIAFTSVLLIDSLDL